MPGFKTRIGADITAFPPLGTIATTVSAGCDLGIPPHGASMLLVTVAGTASTSRAVVQALGGYAQAHAELSITIEEWGPKKFQVPAKLIRSITFNPTKIFDDWGVGISYQLRIDDGTPFASVAGMPVFTATALPPSAALSHSFLCWVNLYQFATVEGVSGYALAGSNVVYDFTPPFFTFV
jgi:hypothetical protein